MTTRRQIKSLIKQKMFDPVLTQPIIELVEDAIDKRKPLLLDGQAGCGKTAAVYYVAEMRDIKVIEFNASDDLRSKKNIHKLRNKLQMAHDGIWIILLDEVDKTSNLKLLTELVYKNKMNVADTVIIAITNYGWTLKQKIKIDDDLTLSFIEAFGAGYQRVYRPWPNLVAKSLKSRKIVPKMNKSLSTDLRDYEKMVLLKDFETNDAVDFRNAFWIFRDFISKPSYNRSAVPTPKQLGSALETWLIKNGFSNHKQNSFRWHRADFQRAIELLSFSKLFDSEDLKLFLPSFWLQKGSYKHPASI